LGRRIVLALLLAALITASWLRLEVLSVSWREWAPMLLLAAVPVAVAAFAHSRLAVAAALLGTTVFAASAAFEVPLSEARPRDPQRDFFGPVLDGIRQGFLDFYETQLPFDRIDFPLMHALILLAIFAFSAIAGLFVLANRPIGAALTLVVAVGWPATLIPGGSALRSGALALVGVLAILFLLRGEGRPRGLLQAAGVAGLLVAVAVAVSTSEAVAKPAFLSWQSWDPYDRPTEPVSVDYVWKANYDGITFPEEPTTVMRVKVSGSKRSLYWRATTLDDYTGQIWDEDLQLGEPEQREEIDVVDGNDLLPEAAAEEDNWVRQDITVEALRDTHLLASSQPVRWRPGTDAPVAEANGGDVLVVPDTLRRGQRYTVWSYVPRPNPSQLAEFQGDYPSELQRYLEVVFQPVPEWSAESRETLMRVFFRAENADQFEIAALESLYDAALGVTSEARTPYEATVLLETWFREAGGFTYDEQPPAPIGGQPALVDFVNETKQGYCQHYAGAMTLMLRLLGIPARVAVGFTSGSYDDDDKEWIVSDTNAHAWVEVFFPRFGWIPFDPTPGRGQLGATYSAYSGEFNNGDAADIGLADTIQGLSPALAEQIRSANPALEGAEGFGNPASGGAVSVVRDRGPSLVVLVALVLAAAYLAVVLLKALLRALRFATRDPRALAAACRRDIVGYLADQGVSVPGSATLPEIGATLERYFGVSADPFVRDLTQARFGRPAQSDVALHRARRELRELRRSLRRRLSAFNRLRGAASLRSLSL
jgi:transglutaminase-like putative cysteine protease